MAKIPQNLAGEAEKPNAAIPEPKFELPDDIIDPNGKPGEGVNIPTPQAAPQATPQPTPQPGVSNQPGASPQPADKIVLDGAEVSLAEISEWRKTHQQKDDWTRTLTQGQQTLKEQQKEFETRLGTSLNQPASKTPESANASGLSDADRTLLNQLRWDTAASALKAKYPDADMERIAATMRERRVTNLETAYFIVKGSEQVVSAAQQGMNRQAQNLVSSQSFPVNGSAAVAPSAPNSTRGMSVRDITARVLADKRVSDGLVN